MDQQLLQTIESCRECVSICKACAASLKQEESIQECSKACLECAMICELCVSLGEGRSLLFPKSLELAMDACMNCIDLCENSVSDNCKKCAWQCRKATVDFMNIIR